MNQSVFLAAFAVMLIALFWMLATHPEWVPNALAFITLGVIVFPVVTLLVAFLLKR